MSTLLIIIICIVVFVAIAGIVNSQKVKNRDRELLDKGVSFDQFIPAGKYLCGHPKIENPLKLTLLLPSNNDIDIYFQNEYTDGPMKGASIPKQSIKNISVEDASTMEKKVTLTRMVLIGIFAFAAKKKVKNELAYVVISWNDGKFNHETTFEFEGKDATLRADSSRNRLINSIS